MNSKIDILNENILIIKPDILACVETRYKNILDIHKFDNYESFHKLQSGTKTGGVSVWARKDTKTTRLDIDNNDDDISNNYMWVLCQNKGLTAICTVYLKNQSDVNAREINNQICQRLLTHITWCKIQNYNTIIIGDFNAHIGNDEQGIIGNHTEINNNGIIVRSFIHESGLSLVNNSPHTYGTWTWGMNRKNTNPQILDIMLTSNLVEIKNMEIDENNTIYGNGNGDHCFLLCNCFISQQISSLKPLILKQKWNIQDESDWQKYKNRILEIKNENYDNIQNINEYDIIKITTSAAEDAIGYRKQGEKIKKESKQIKNIKKNITELRKNLRHTSGYKGVLLNDLFILIRQLKQIRIRNEMARIERAHNKWINNPKRKFSQLYDTMKSMKRGIKENVTLIDKDKIPIIGDININLHLKTFWENIFTLGIWPESDYTLKRLGLSDIINGPDKRDLENEITINEIQKAIKKLKNGTSAGTTNIAAEFMKNWPEEMIHTIQILFNKWFESGYFPDMGKIQEVTLLHKKGSKSNISNYRTLCLGCNLCKLYLMILTHRIENITEKKGILGYIQHGFRANKRIEDCIMVIQHTIQKAKKCHKNQNPTIALLDICKAYDRVWRDGLWKKLEIYGFPTKLLNAIKSSYHNPGAKITFQETITGKLEMPVGLRQGCTMSPILWALYIADLGKEIELCNYGVTIGAGDNERNISGLFFADDMLLFSKNEDNMLKLLNIVSNYAQKWKIEFSGPKSLIIPLKRNINKDRKWPIGHKYLNESESTNIYIQEENEAKYLGITISKHKTDMISKHKQDLAERTRKESFRCLKPATSTSRPILYGAKIWKTYVIPKILHGIAAIPYSNNTFTRIETQQREYIRMISKLPRHTHRAVLYGETDIIPIQIEADKRTINYLAHIQNLSTDNIVKIAFLEQEETYNNNQNTKCWLQHAITCCSKYNIDYKLIPNANIIKKMIYDKWNRDYIEMMESASTLRIYKHKCKPKINYKLNMHTGGEYWIKAKAGSLLLNNKVDAYCSRCDNQKLETLDHLLWECESNIFLDNYEHNIYKLWLLLPTVHNNILKPNYYSCSDDDRIKFLSSCTEYVLDDDVSGHIINITGNIISDTYKIRPEIIQYNIINNIK